MRPSLGASPPGSMRKRLMLAADAVQAGNCVRPPELP